MLEDIFAKWAAEGEADVKKHFGGVTHQTPKPPPVWAHGTDASKINIPSSTERPHVVPKKEKS